MQSEIDGLAGYILTTDKKKNAELWFVPTKSIVDAFTCFAKSDIASVKKARNENGRLTYWSAK